MRAALIALLLAGAGTGAPAFAQETTPARGVFKNGADLYAACTSTKQADVDACDWFLMGAHDMATFYFDTSQLQATFCLPKGSTVEAVRKIAVDRLRAKPQTRNYSAVSGYLNALAEAYPGPCKS